MAVLLELEELSFGGLVGCGGLVGRDRLLRLSGCLLELLLWLLLILHGRQVLLLRRVAMLGRLLVLLLLAVSGLVLLLMQLRDLRLHRLLRIVICTGRRLAVLHCTRLRSTLQLLPLLELRDQLAQETHDECVHSCPRCFCKRQKNGSWGRRETTQL